MEVREKEEIYLDYIKRWCYLQGSSLQYAFCDSKIAFAMYDSDIGLSVDIYASYEEIFNDCFSYNIRETILDCADVLEDEFDEEEIDELKTLVGIEEKVTDEEIKSLTDGYQGLIYDFCNALEPVIKNHKEMFVSKNGEYEPETIAKDMSNTMWSLEHMHGIYEDGFDGDTKYNDMFYNHAEEILKHLKLEMYHDLDTDEYKIIRKGK